MIRLYIQNDLVNTPNSSFAVHIYGHYYITVDTDFFTETDFWVRKKHELSRDFALNHFHGPNPHGFMDENSALEYIRVIFEDYVNKKYREYERNDPDFKIEIQEIKIACGKSKNKFKKMKI